MGWLVAAALLWVGVHVGIAGTRLRGAAVAWLGARGFMIAFSVASVVAISLLVVAWQSAPVVPLWFAPNPLRWVLALAMLPAFVLFVASVSGPNPTAAGQQGILAAPVRGIQRITRHPMLWSFALWGIIHVVGNGDLASIVFFGAFAVTALAGMPSIDAKLAARAPAAWAGLAGATSILPGAAIIGGRNRLVLREIGWVPPVVGLIAWAALLYLHPAVFGVAAVLAN